METPISPTIITGGGRCGTTAFMRFIHKAKGFDACFSDALIHENSTTVFSANHHGGYEYFLTSDSPDDAFRHCPQFIKSPKFTVHLNSLINEGKVLPNHVFLLIRDYKKSAKSRLDRNLLYLEDKNLRQYNSRYSDLKNQEIFFQRCIGIVMDTISKHDLNFTVLRFPDFINNKEYLYKKLKGTPLDPSGYDFDEAFSEFNPEFVNY